MHLSKRFWNVYAFCYDGLNGLIPYQELIQSVVKATKIDDSHKRLLDLGCGTGNLLRAFQIAHPHLELYGVDRSSQMLNRARGKLGSEAHIVTHDLNDPLFFRDGYFDVVVSTLALYTIKHPEIFLEDANRVLRPGGRLIVVNPKGGHPANIRKQHIEMIIQADLAQSVLLSAQTLPFLPRIFGIDLCNRLIAKQAENMKLQITSADDLESFMNEVGIRVDQVISSAYADTCVLVAGNKLE